MKKIARTRSPPRGPAAAGAALADINVGVSLSLTGPGSGLGIPMENQFKLWPDRRSPARRST